MASDDEVIVHGNVPLRWVTLFFFPLAATVYLTGLTMSPYEKGFGSQVLASIGVIALFVGVIVFCLWSQRRYVRRPLLAWRGWKKWALELLIAVPVALGLTLLLSVLASKSPELRQLMNPNQVLYQPVIVAPVVYGVVAVLLAPLAEELLYRGVLYQSLRSRMQPLLAVVLQALMFGVMHPHGYHYMLMAFGSALVFMGVRLWRKTLWSPIHVHALVNGSAVLPFLVMLFAAGDELILGVATEDFRETQGARVTAVLPGSPAEEIGLRTGDVMISLNERVVTKATDVGDIVSRCSHGEKVTVEVQRDGRALHFAIELRKRRPSVLW